MKTSNHVYYLNDNRAVKKWRVVIARKEGTRNFGTFATKREALAVAKRAAAEVNADRPKQARYPEVNRTELEAKQDAWENRILPNVTKTARGCWLFAGRKNNGGYGLCDWRTDGQKHASTAHRVALEATSGKLLGERIACHRCGNPPCGNPAHLFAGTHSDNLKDSIAKGRRK